MPAVRRAMGDGGADEAPAPPRGGLASALGVRPEEVERVRGLVGASFLLGTALVLFYSAANATFLTRYDIDVLPWVYIVNALTVIAVGLAFGHWSARVPAGRALVALAAALAASTGLLWLWATLSEDRSVAFVMAVWFRLLFIFAVLGLWEVASAVFDIRQAKRLFAAVALGMMSAFVVGGVATPALSSWLGTRNLVGVAAVFFALYTFDFRRLLRRHGVGAAARGSVAPAGPVEIMADRYSRRMVWMKSVTILLLYVTEYVFYEQAAETFDVEASLAGFLGMFMGAMTVLMVVVTGVVSGRFISRFGVRAATLALPVGMLVVALPSGAYGTVVGVDTLFFALVCATLATDHVVGNAIGEPAGAILFQPMAPERRMRVRLAVDGWLGSVALAASGLVLLLFQAVDLDSVAPYLFVVAAIAAVGIVVAIRQHGDYVGALRQVTTLGFQGTRRDRPLDPLEREFLLEGLGSDDPAAVAAAAGLMRSMALDPLGPMLPGLLGHEAPEVVELALGSVSHSGDARHAPQVAATCLRADLPARCRAQALHALAVLDPDQARRTADTVLGRPADELLPTALAVGLTHGSPEASTLVRELARSPQAPERAVAAAALAGAPARDWVDDLHAELLEDPDPAVVDAALDAAAARGGPAPLVGGLLRRARTRRHGHRAVEALAAAGPAAVGPVQQAWPDLSVPVAVEAVGRILAPHVAAPVIVATSLGPSAPSALRRAGFVALTDVAAPEMVAPLLDADLRLLGHLVAAHRDLRDAAPVVASALAAEFEAARRSVYAALGVELGRSRLSDIETLVLAGDDDDRANAIEALELLLAPDRRRALIGALEPLDVTEAAGSWRELPPRRPPVELLRELRDDPRLTSWTRRVAAWHLDPRTDGATTMAPTISRVLALKRIDIFSTLPYTTLEELAEAVQAEEAAPGTVIIEAGAVGRELYAITSGTVEVRTREGHVSQLHDGTVFGELALLDPAPRSASVSALTAVELLVVTRSTLLALADRRPVVMAEIARILARRLRAH